MIWTILSRIRTSISQRLTPPRIFILSFALAILIGAILLWLPFSAGGGQLSFVDALFSSASAVCVTGLAVIDIGKDLSFAGQIVTLVLFQIGGLGIITFSVVLFGLMGRGISFKGREIVQSTFLHTPRRDFIVIVKGVLLLTFISEAVGTILLFIRFAQDFPPAHGLLSRPLQRRLGLQQLRLLPLFGQPDVLPGGLDRQPDRDGAHRPRGDRLHRPVGGDRPVPGDAEEALAPHEDSFC